ncbi:hypothetical protein GALMADRAFT_146353 [Galerina marginata CBS 339.88]|uniref:Uncharacterized protein n=1 Tax=Galerina marginata (strain CBS 339.88) TaxID=685588 RepID=A0A067SBV4_GALM3|nr:hypothetical protein GALMADRAFT_146353 [Galerina marginata CBS 339.88]
MQIHPNPIPRRVSLNLVYVASVVGFLALFSAVLTATTTKTLCTSAHDHLPLFFLTIATRARICRPEAKASIPSLLFSPELGAMSLISLDTNEMFKNRLGKITAALSSIGTPESQQTISAIERYDDQAKSTIRNLAKLGAASKLAHKTVIGILTGLIQSLTAFPTGEKSPYVLQVVTRSRQAQIDAWVAGLQDQLAQLLLQCNIALEDLDSSDLHLFQIIQTSGRSEGGQEKNMAEDDNYIAPMWIRSLFGHKDIRPAALKAISNLESLIKTSSAARKVVENLSNDLVGTMVGIEAAYHYPDRMLVVEMTLEEEVEAMVDMLKRLRREAQTSRISNGLNEA